MMTRVELMFLHLFRKTVIATAGLALLVSACGIIYWAYAKYSPNPASYADRVSEFRERLSVSELVRAHFSADTTLVREVKTVFPLPKNYVVTPSWNSPFKESYQDSYNVYLTAMFDVSYNRPRLFGQLVNRQRVEFNSEITDETASDEKNFWVFFGSLFVAYVDELEKATPKLVELKKSGDYASSFKKLEEDDYDRAMTWFFSEFAAAVEEVDQEFLEREVLRLKSSLGLIVAASAFAYFILVMFFFLAASAEIHIRRISDTLDSSKGAE